MLRLTALAIDKGLPPNRALGSSSATRALKACRQAARLSETSGSRLYGTRIVMERMFIGALESRPSNERQWKGRSTTRSSLFARQLLMDGEEGTDRRPTFPRSGPERRGRCALRGRSKEYNSGTVFTKFDALSESRVTNSWTYPYENQPTTPAEAIRTAGPL